MDPETAIDCDVPCRSCGYNLRTLAITARCPECEFPALRSFMAHRVDPTRSFPLEIALRHQSCLVLLSRLLRRNVDAITFVVAANEYACKGQRQVVGHGAAVRHVGAAALCRAIGEYAMYRYGDRADAIATLRFWRIERSEDVGQIVAGLAEAGLMQASDEDSPADFSGLFVLDELLSEQKR